MRFPLLRPRWLGIHLVAVLAVLGCLVLGHWQYENAKRPERGTITNPVEDVAAAGPLDTLLSPGAPMPRDLANEAVTATGRYDAERQLLAPALSPEGEEGYSVVVPLVTADGVAVAVNRGWLPADAADGALPPVPTGEVTVRGWLLPPQDEASRGYSAITSEGRVARISPALLVNEWPHRLYEGYVVLAEQEPDTAAPALRRIPPPDPPQEIVWNFRNLSYAAQWWVFGLAAAAFWVSLVRRELADRRTDGGDTDGGRVPRAAAAQPSADTAAD